MSRRVVSQGTNQPSSQSSSAISDVTSPVKHVGKVRTRCQASSSDSDRANWPGYEAGDKQQLIRSPHTRNRGQVCFFWTTEKEGGSTLQVQTLTLLYTIYDRKQCAPFVYVLLTNGFPFYIPGLELYINPFYHIDTSVLLENIPLVKIHKDYIRDPSGLLP